MKKLATLLMITLVTLTSISCSNDDAPAVVVTPPPAAADGFTWKENGGTTVKTGVNPRFSTQYNTFIVEDAAGGTLFEINLNAGTPATYNLGPNYAIAYTASAFNPTAGSLIITANANNKISGTFTATGSTGTVTSIQGVFTNVSVIP